MDVRVRNNFRFLSWDSKNLISKFMYEFKRISSCIHMDFKNKLLLFNPEIKCFIIVLQIISDQYKNLGIIKTEISFEISTL